MAMCQGGEGVVWSGALHDGNSVILLLVEHVGTREMGFEGTGVEVVWGNGRRRGGRGGLGDAGHEGVGTGCMGACILGDKVP